MHGRGQWLPIRCCGFPLSKLSKALFPPPPLRTGNLTVTRVVLQSHLPPLSPANQRLLPTFFVVVSDIDNSSAMVAAI